VSSENLLVLMARDKVQGDLLVRRFMAPDDAFVNSDVNNTPWCASR
jgi:predicted ribosome quality control (RQC) complex YloA/Tae2 family protein